MHLCFPKIKGLFVIIFAQKRLQNNACQSNSRIRIQSDPNTPSHPQVPPPCCEAHCNGPSHTNAARQATATRNLRRFEEPKSSDDPLGPSKTSLQSEGHIAASSLFKRFQPGSNMFQASNPSRFRCKNNKTVSSAATISCHSPQDLRPKTAHHGTRCQLQSLVPCLQGAWLHKGLERETRAELPGLLMKFSCRLHEDPWSKIETPL